MTIPSFQETFIPILHLLQDDKIHTKKEITLHIISLFKLSDEEKAVRLPSGTNFLINDRVTWGIMYLKKACLIQSIKNGEFSITKRGHETINSKPEKINVAYLMRFPEFAEYRTKRASNVQVAATTTQQELVEKTSEERISEAYEEISNALADEILESIISRTPAFLERLIVKLIVAMGYGGSVEEAGEVLGKSGDNGIDGIIKEDPLGLDTIYLQAKRYKESNTTGRPEIQAFVGALTGHHANKGIFITTSEFSKQAHDFVKQIPQKVILIDGQKLARLMITHNVGVSIASTYHIKKIDSDFFEE
jgi:restriction system protein